MAKTPTTVDELMDFCERALADVPVGADPDQPIAGVTFTVGDMNALLADIYSRRPKLSEADKKQALFDIIARAESAS